MEPLKVFYSYAHEDRELCEELKKYLIPLKRAGVISDWYDRDISAGTEWEKQVDHHLGAADLIVLLVSADFMASDYCWGVEVKRAMERHEKGEARVIPVILRPCYWQVAPFSKLQCLPTEARPVTDWPSKDAALLDVTTGIGRATEELRQLKEQQRAEERRRVEEQRRPPPGMTATVLVSYSHKDKEWLDRLRVHLEPLQQEAAIDLWDDTRIHACQKWQEEIRKALENAQVAVLLISADFLASDFIRRNELPPLLQAAQEKGVLILPVLAKPSGFSTTPSLASFQAVNRGLKTLMEMDDHEREELFVELANVIEDALRWPKPEDSVKLSALDGLSASASNRSGHKPSLPPIQLIHGWSAEYVQELQVRTAAALGLGIVFRDSIPGGGPVPEMVVIPAGEFLMGSPEHELERKDNEGLHQVRIEQPFAIGKYAVTFEEYDRFAYATGRALPDDSGWGRGRLPVINVDWYDAVAYAEWLSGQTGKQYRLPTEAEWEYAARAGTAKPFWFGETIKTGQANYNGNYVYGNGRKGTYRKKTVPVDTFEPNPWELYNVHGNVWEWTCSKYESGYNGAEKRCMSKNDASVPRVIRGGSWHANPRWLRSAGRNSLAPDKRVSRWGFRLARSLTL